MPWMQRPRKVEPWRLELSGIILQSNGMKFQKKDFWCATKAKSDAYIQRYDGIKTMKYKDSIRFYDPYLKKWIGPVGAPKCDCENCKKGSK